MSDSIYHSYTSFINSAKALLVAEGVKTNTQAEIVKQFDDHFVATSQLKLKSTFSEKVYQINKEEPTKKFAEQYLQDAKELYKKIDEYRLEAVAI